MQMVRTLGQPLDAILGACRACDTGGRVDELVDRFRRGQRRIPHAEEENVHYAESSAVHSSRTLVSPSRGRKPSAKRLASGAGTSRRPAHTAAPRTSGWGSSSRARANGNSAPPPLLPTAI